MLKLKLDALLLTVEEELRASLDLARFEHVDGLRTRLEDMLEEAAEERAEIAMAHVKGLAELARERTKGLAEVAEERANLAREIVAMQNQQKEQQGCVVLDIGGFRYTTSVQTVRRIPGTFSDAFFSGRNTMDPSEDGSIFIDRDGEHFGHVLEYVRDDVMSLAKRDTSELDVGMLQRLKQEVDFYCIDVVEMQDVAYVVVGNNPKPDDFTVASVERFAAVSGLWRGAAPMSSERFDYGLCELANELYLTGGNDDDCNSLATVERYDPVLDSWSAVPPMPGPRSGHCACGIGDVLYVLGGSRDIDVTLTSVLKSTDLRRSGARWRPCLLRSISQGHVCWQAAFTC
jgi:hypothetical protein